MRVYANPDYPGMKLIDGVERIEFKCKRCGDCCRNRGDITLFPQDIPRIAKFLGMKSGDEFLKEYANKLCPSDRPSFYRYVIKDKGDSACTCIFLDENQKCRIHEVKPPACFMYPFVPIGSELYGECKIQANHCVYNSKLGTGLTFNEYLKEIPVYEEEFEIRKRFNHLMTSLMLKPYSKFYQAMYSAISRALFDGYEISDGKNEVEERLEQAEHWASYI